MLRRHLSRNRTEERKRVMGIDWGKEFQAEESANAKVLG